MNLRIKKQRLHLRREQNRRMNISKLAQIWRTEDRILYMAGVVVTFSSSMLRPSFCTVVYLRCRIAPCILPIVYRSQIARRISSCPTWLGLSGLSISCDYVIMLFVL